MITSDTILRLAGMIPQHNLREVRGLRGFNTWGVDSQPGQMPTVLYVGDDSREFGPPCWPFMAAHEGLHSIATQFLETDDYRFILYNICEDWRINAALRGIFHDRMAQSYRETRSVILRRWQKDPFKLLSPASQALQHLCYLNHLPECKPKETLPSGYLEELLWIRDQFGHVDNWPLVPATPSCPARASANARISERLIRLIREHCPPRDINPVELRELLCRMGYDLSFRLDLVGPRFAEETSKPCNANHLEE
jgi:hypothetical protein